MITKETTKATLYLDSEMYKTLKLRAAETGQSLSSLMNEALEGQLAEDLDDIQSIRTRVAKNEKPLSYEVALKKLKDGGTI